MRSAPKRLHDTVKKQQSEVRAIVVPISKEDSDIAASKIDDPWETLTKAEKVVTPPFDLFALATFPEYNSELNQCIEALEVNISGFGFQLISLDSKIDPSLSDPDSDITPERAVSNEYDRFMEFLNYGSVDGGSNIDTRRQLRRDLESTGNAYIEFLADSNGSIVGYNAVPSYQMRLGVTDDAYTIYEETRLVSDGKGYNLKKVKRRKRFRRYVQQHRYAKGYKQVWFKELDDPRNINCRTGLPMTQEEAQKSPHMLANPMIHIKLYSPRTPYGVPRYVGNLLSILGGRASEEINYTTFKNNNMPSMLLMVSNGALTQGTIDRISSFTESVIQGSDNYSKFLIIEADPDDEDGGGQVKIEAKPLVGNQHNDALFQNYDKNTTDKIRRAFRLPPIFVGRSDDYTRATAETAKKIGDEQVFAPERSVEDHLWNRVLRHMGMKYHVFKSNTPNVTDDKDLINVMKEGERSGAVTPRIARRMLEDILGQRLPDMSEKVDLDVPFSMQMAEAVKNLAKPNEVGQQVTSLKGEYESATKALSSAKFQGIYVPSMLVSDIITGKTQKMSIPTETQIWNNHLYALVDADECFGLVEFSKSDGEEYNILNFIPIEPTDYEGKSPDDFGEFEIIGEVELL